MNRSECSCSVRLLGINRKALREGHNIEFVRMHRFGAVTRIDARLSSERGMKFRILICTNCDLLCTSIEKRNLKCAIRYRVRDR